MNRMMRAIALSSVMAIPAFAMANENLSQLQILAQDALQQAGISYPVEALTPAQLAEIKALVTEEENDIDTQLRTILEQSNPEANTLDVAAALPERSQLEILAQKELDQAGIDHDATTLSDAQLAEIKALSTQDDGDKTSELQVIIDG